MRRLHVVSAAAALLAIISVSACSSTSAPQTTTGSAPTAAASTGSAPTAAASTGSAPTTAASTGSAPTAAASTGSAPTAAASTGSEATEKPFEDFDPNKFDRSTNIDNEWMPLKPGTRYIYEGTTIEDDGTAVPHRVEINVTDLTKLIGGIRSVVTWDLDYSDNQLVEAELAFFAQDTDGNVWRMGEYPEAYEDEKLIEAPTWIHGFEDAQAGIMMKAKPQLGTPSYSQGWGPAVDWTDRGQVDQIGQKTCVPADCYEDVLVIAETSQSEPNAFQLKYWARGVGNVRVGWRGAGEKTKETLELTEVVQLSPEALAEARTKALELEKSAYENSKNVYSHTPPLEALPGVIISSAPTAAVSTGSAPTAVASTGSTPTGEVVVYASDLPESALSEFEIWDDPASPGGKLVGTPNTGGHLDPPPEDDPHVIFNVSVQGGIPYRCWVHMKVGAPQGESQANLLWVQISNAVDKANQEVFKPDTGSYLTASGPAQEGWAWVGCDLAGSDSLIYFQTGGEVTVRMQAGMEGVGFDQFVLSSAQFLVNPPSEAVIKK
jgi:hypothetical protein